YHAAGRLGALSLFPGARFSAFGGLAFRTGFGDSDLFFSASLCPLFGLFGGCALLADNAAGRLGDIALSRSVRLFAGHSFLTLGNLAFGDLTLGDLALSTLFE